MNGFSLVCYIDDYKKYTLDDLFSIYDRLSDYCTEHVLKYEFILLTPSGLDVSELTKFFSDKNIKNFVKIYKCSESLTKVGQFMFSVGSFKTTIFLDITAYTKGTIGLEYLFTEYLKKEYSCCLGLFKDNNSNYNELNCIIFNRDDLFADFDKVRIKSINELMRLVLYYYSYIGVAERYNGIISHFKLYDITIQFSLAEKIRRLYFIHNVRNNYYKEEKKNRLKYTSKGRKKDVNL